MGSTLHNPELHITYPLVNITNDTLEVSLSILMKKRWDGKLSKMAHTFGFEYKASQLKDHFSNLVMDFNGERITNPLDFLDKLVQIRHRVVHASSIFEEGRLINIDINFIPEFFFSSIISQIILMTYSLSSLNTKGLKSILLRHNLSLHL